MSLRAPALFCLPFVILPAIEGIFSFRTASYVERKLCLVLATDDATDSPFSANKKKGQRIFVPSTHILVPSAAP